MSATSKIAPVASTEQKLMGFAPSPQSRSLPCRAICPMPPGERQIICKPICPAPVPAVISPPSSSPSSTTATTTTTTQEGLNIVIHHHHHVHHHHHEHPLIRPLPFPRDTIQPIPSIPTPICGKPPGARPSILSHQHSGHRRYGRNHEGLPHPHHPHRHIVHDKCHLDTELAQKVENGADNEPTPTPIVVEPSIRFAPGPNWCGTGRRVRCPPNATIMPVENQVRLAVDGPSDGGCGSPYGGIIPPHMAKRLNQAKFNTTVVDVLEQKVEETIVQDNEQQLDLKLETTGTIDSNYTIDDEHKEQPLDCGSDELEDNMKSLDLLLEQLVGK